MGLFSKIFKGIKKIVKGVAKVIKKTVKGVAKVVKKVAKSKIFKAILTAGAIYVTGGAALSSFGTAGTGLFSSTGAFGKWATQYGSGIFSSGIGKAVATPFRVLGTGLGKGARAITDFTGITDPIGTESILSPTAATETATEATVRFDGTTVQPDAASTAASTTASDAPIVRFDGTTVQPDAASTAASTAKGSGWKDYLARGTIVGDVVRGVGTSVATGYVMDKINPPFEEGRMAGLSLEGEGQLDPFAVYYGDGKPLSVAEAYSQLLYGTGDPMYNKGNTSNLYIQDLQPVV